VGHYNPEVSNRYLSSMFEIKNIDLSGVYILWVTYLFYDEPFLRKLYQVTLGHVYSNYERKLILPCIPPPNILDHESPCGFLFTVVMTLCELYKL
jgi:hypothetical protein